MQELVNSQKLGRWIDYYAQCPKDELIKRLITAEIKRMRNYKDRQLMQITIKVETGKRNRVEYSDKEVGRD